MTDGCVKLGDDDIPESWSCWAVWVVDGGIEGAVDITDGVFEVDIEAEAGGAGWVWGETWEGVPWVLGAGVTAAAAAAAYRIGGSVFGGLGAGCKPALRMLAIGCCAKFRFGGGFAVSWEENK